ncbi:MAG: hypothetical protein AAF480_19550 [Actinomycetota bacterium]
MTRAKLIVLGLGLAIIAVFAAPASAQEAREITVEPAYVEAPGEAELTISGAGWTMPPTAVIPCTAPESGDLLDVDSATCDTGLLTPVTPDADGNFSATITVDVPAEGIAIVGFDLATQGQNEAGGAIVPVGAPAEEGAEEGGSEDAAQEETAEEGGEEELADTGVESGLLAIIAIAVLGGGAMVVGYTRRFA